MAHVPSPFARRRCRSSPTATANTSRASRTSGSGSAFGVSAAFVAVCCSTLVLQAITTPAPSAAPLAPPVVSASAAATSSTHETRAAELFDALLARVSSSVRAAATKAITGSSGSAYSEDADDSGAVDMRAMDLRISNVSVHRVRYVENSGPGGSCSAGSEHGTAGQSGDQQCAEDDADAEKSGANGSTSLEQSADSTESFMGRWTRKVRSLHVRRRAEVTSVVVTWDDHFRGASSITDDSDDDDEPADSPVASSAERRSARQPSGPVVTYEVQHWVHGWGLDALWHPSNRKLSVADPFVVLSNLPPEHAIAFRVRMKVQKSAGLLSTGWFATETEGPWSAVALLSPSRDDALAAIAAFLLSNKAFSLVLLLCIGSGSLVVCRLFVLNRFTAATGSGASGARMRSTSTALATVATPMSELSMGGDSETASDSDQSTLRQRSRQSSSTGRRSRVASGDLAQEITHLRQELADSEAEVRKLMLFRGYGVEQLAPRELAAIEHELRATLQHIQRLRQSQPASHRSNSVAMSSEDETEGDDSDRVVRTSSSVDGGSSGSNGGDGVAAGTCRAGASRGAARRRLGAVLEGVSAAM